MRALLPLALLLAGCSTLYPAPGVDPQPQKCVTACGASFQGDDCAGFAQLEARTVRAFGECDAGSAADACAALADWTVNELPPAQTVARDDAGDRGWHPRNAGEVQQLALETHGDGGGLIYGETTCPYRLIELADEHWPSGVAVTEMEHAAARECFGNPYPAWGSNGRECVRARVVASYRDGGA